VYAPEHGHTTSTSAPPLPAHGTAAASAAAGGGAAAGTAHCGRAMQVDPIKPTLKAPGTERLKLHYDELLSKFAFKFNMRRYIVVDRTAYDRMMQEMDMDMGD
jgi:hypothetical protein